MKVGFDLDLSVANAIFTILSVVGQFFYSIFLKDLVSWNAMITAYSRHGMGMHAAETFQLMLQNGFSPDYIRYVAVLSGCRHSIFLEQERNYFRFMTRVHKISPGLKHYSFIGSSPRP
jgi:pentatricopeptide repeat protein